ncbi:hypothetical protein [uncultured Friedmanniella sp.]|uniref:hypothetical protein n=1 Tax=uncultured Friedmanniella sp. TaxID=335381 RepID=UPI0035CC7383
MDTTKNIRPLDYVLTAAMVALGVFIGVENVTAGPNADVAHPLDSHSPLIVAVFIVAALPILWRRRHILAAVGVSTVVLAISLPAFGWITRCGFALPLSVAMAYAVARFAGSRRHQVVGLVGILAHQVLTLVHDSSTGGLNALAISVPAAAICYGTGLLVQRGARSTAEPTLSSAEHVHA